MGKCTIRYDSRNLDRICSTVRNENYCCYYAVSRLCSNYGVRCSWVANTEKNILSALQSGYPVIAHMGPGIFTKNGHYIVLRGVTADGKILVNDPNSSKRTQMAFPLSTIIEQARRANSFGVCKPMK